MGAGSHSRAARGRRPEALRCERNCLASVSHAAIAAAALGCVQSLVRKLDEVDQGPLRSAIREHGDPDTDGDAMAAVGQLEVVDAEPRDQFLTGPGPPPDARELGCWMI